MQDEARVVRLQRFLMSVLAAVQAHSCAISPVDAQSAAAVSAQEEAGYKLLKVKRNQFGKGGVPFIATHDGRTIRYPDPDIKVRSSTCWAQQFCACMQAHAPYGKSYL